MVLWPLLILSASIHHQPPRVTNLLLGMLESDAVVTGITPPGQVTQTHLEQLYRALKCPNVLVVGLWEETWNNT